MGSGPANSPPTIKAGFDQAVQEGETVALSGTAADPDPGDTLTCVRTHNGTILIRMTGSDTPSPRSPPRWWARTRPSHSP